MKSAFPNTASGAVPSKGRRRERNPVRGLLDERAFTEVQKSRHERHRYTTHYNRDQNQGALNNTTWHRFPLGRPIPTAFSLDIGD
jgi:hypothetical protein